MVEAESNPDPDEIVRYKFSLSRGEAERLDDLAEEHQSGNRSALIREAVQVYGRMMGESGGLPDIKQLKIMIENIEDTIAQIESKIDEIEQPNSEPVTVITDGSVSNETDDSSRVEESNENQQADTDEISDQAKQVLEQESPDPCSVEVVASQTGLSLDQARRALDGLVARDAATEAESNSDSQKYELTVNSSIDQWISSD